MGSLFGRLLRLTELLSGSADEVSFVGVPVIELGEPGVGGGGGRLSTARPRHFAGGAVSVRVGAFVFQ